jgi:hypothetical protein
MIGINELRRLNPQAWTSLLAQDTDHGSIRVTAVERQKLNLSDQAFRYVLSLDGYLEPISLIGKETNVPEALFFGNIANEISEIAPHCWICHIEGDKGWVIHEESYNDYLPAEWAAVDIERIIDRLVNLHALMWEQEEELGRIGFSSLIGGGGPEIGKELLNKDPQALLQPLKLSKRIASWDRGDLSLPSEHAISSAGNLGLELIHSAIALEKIIQRGGWPGVFEDSHRQAAADLLDDPMPMLYPLAQLPSTLIHGNAAPQSWSLDLLDNCQLSDWRSASIGPSIYDLVCFIENLNLIQDKKGKYSLRQQWSISEETILDSYILAMGRHLGSEYSPVLTRQAFPAAVTLYVLIVEIPKLANWIEKGDGDQFNWASLSIKNDDKLQEAGYSEIAALRPFWSNVFTKFLSAYRSL